MSLDSLVKDATLIKKLNQVKEYATENLLRFWQIHSPHFVDHGVTHCANIESLLFRIIPPHVREKMNEYEVFLLLCGVWLHDIGMLAKNEGENDRQVRDTHHIRSRELIRKALPEIELTEDERYIVGEIAFFHRKVEDIGNAKEVFETLNGSVVSKVRIRYLCALVRLADGCEIAHSRSSRKLMEITDLDEEAKFHHEAHLHVSAVDFDNISHEITICLRVKSQEDALLLSNFLKGNIEKELFSVKSVLCENDIDYSIVKPDITIDALAEEMPKADIRPKSMSLEEKLVEIEKRTGYYPSMVIDTDPEVHIFYETIAQTSKELQSEIISVLGVIWHLFMDKERVLVTLNRIHDLSGTIGGFDVEIVTVVAERKDFEEFSRNTIKKGEFWSKLSFLRRATNDKFFNKKIQLSWKLVL
jgi:hypothetical protein